MDKVKANRVDDLEFKGEPGTYEFVVTHADREKIAGISFICPCGCGTSGWLSVQGGPGPTWQMTGDEDTPTLTPSVLQLGPCKWHGYLTNGYWVSV